MLRRCGDGYKRIAKALGVSQYTARYLVKRAEQIGLVPA
jgi:DNA-binding transcriptional regulator LsrR (DeoR family)